MRTGFPAAARDRGGAGPRAGRVPLPRPGLLGHEDRPVRDADPRSGLHVHRPRLRRVDAGRGDQRRG